MSKEEVPLTENEPNKYAILVETLDDEINDMHYFFKI